MRRAARSFLALLVALALALGVAPASAQELREAPAARSEGQEEEGEGPARITPHDVPRLVSAQVTIPPVPSSYVTRELGWLTLSYPPAAAERVASIVRDADSVKAELTEALGQPVLERVEVRIAPTAADMARLAPVSAPPPAYASGVSYHGLHFVLLTMMAPRGADAVDLDEVFRHEMAHVALEDAVAGHHVPVWFNEGLAVYLSGERHTDRLRALWNATLSDSLIPLADLDRRFPSDSFEVSIAYAQSADFMRFLMRRADRLRFASMIDRVREGEPFERAIARAYGSDLRKLEFQWRSDVEKRYSVIPILTGGGIIWVAVIGGLVYAFVRRKRRAQAILARWGVEEAREDAARARLVATEDAAEAELVRASARLAPAAKVEHGGRWHTLH
jgi:hypothetical protein